MLVVSSEEEEKNSIITSKDGNLLAAFAGLGVVFLVIFLYVKNKRWIWGSAAAVRVVTLNCCEEPFIQNVASTHLRNKLVKTFTFDGGDSSSESERGGGGGGSCLKNSTEIPALISASSSSNFSAPLKQDLISLVEKGKVCMSSQNSSCCSSTTSSIAENKSQKNHHLLLVPSSKVTAEINEIKRSPSNKAVVNHLYERIDDTTAKNRDCIVVMNTDCCEDTHHHNIIVNEENLTISCETDEEAKNNNLLLINDDVDQSREATSPRLVNRCGNLEIALLYDAPMRKMTVHVLQARGIPNKERGQSTNTQVRLILLPSKKQKHKTKIRSGENPQFMESFLLHRVNPEDVNSMGIRLRIYGCERMRRERLIGETVVSFANINLELENNYWLPLESRSNTLLSGELINLARSDSTSSTHSMQHGGVPELLLGLCYNSITGRLSVEVVKGSHFRNLALNRAPDTYIKLNLVSSTGQELAHSKTTIRRGQPNPLFKETFIFQVALFQLADVTLMVSVYNRRGVTKKKELVGWFSLGLNSSGAEELSHWMDMKEFQQEQICRWHILVQS